MENLHQTITRLIEEGKLKDESLEEFLAVNDMATECLRKYTEYVTDHALTASVSISSSCFDRGHGHHQYYAGRAVLRRLFSFPVSSLTHSMACLSCSQVGRRGGRQRDRPGC